MRNSKIAAVVAATIIGASYLIPAFSEIKPAKNNQRLEKRMTIKGAFEVNLTPHVDDEVDTGRLTIDKVYHGELNGVGKGQMLSFRTNTQGSAGYVAIEHFSGTLAGQKGSFTLQHSGTMNRGESKLSVTVVPDSGTDELMGLSGEMDIIIKEGEHFYEFEYAINP